MNKKSASVAVPGLAIRVISDSVGFLIIATCLYLTFSIGKYFAALALFIAGITSFALTRRAHRSSMIASVSQFVCTYAPTGVILTLIAVALSDFSRQFMRVDFGMFYATALQLRIDPRHLYDINAQHQMLQTVTGELEYHWLSFPYPPIVAALFVPLSYFSFRWAYYTMLACNSVLLVSALYLLCKSLFRKRQQWVTLILAASVMLPVYINFVLGQMAFVGLLLYSLFVIDILNKRLTRAGLWVGLLSYKPILIPIPFLILLIRRAWTAIFVTVATLFVLLLLSVAIVGPRGLVANYHVMMMMTNDALVSRMQSLTALTHCLGMPSWSVWWLSMAILGTLGVAALRGWSERWVLGGAVLASLLISPYLQTYDLSLALVAVALAISTFNDMPDSRRTALVLLLFLPVFITVVGQTGGKTWPVVPIILGASYAYCLCKGKVIGPQA